MARSGGVGAFTADNFPVFDWVKPNVYAVLDSNHGYKMIGVGREVARVLMGEQAPLLDPFRFERFATGDLHPVHIDPAVAEILRRNRVDKVMVEKGSPLADWLERGRAFEPVDTPSERYDLFTVDLEELPG